MRMEYREGMGFLDDDTMMDAAMLGIGTPPVKPVVVEQPVYQQEYYQQPEQEEIISPYYKAPVVQEQPVVQNEPQLSDEELFNKANAYLGITPKEQKRNENSNDFLNDILNGGSQNKPEEEDDGVVSYRREIVKSAIKLNQDPSEIETYIASMTPEEQVYLAMLKRDYEKGLINGNSQQRVEPVQQQQPRRQLEFQSLKQRPTPSIVNAQAAPVDSNNYQVGRSNIIENKIRNQFY
jgi:hypothetical protein